MLSSVMPVRVSEAAGDEGSGRVALGDPASMRCSRGAVEEGGVSREADWRAGCEKVVCEFAD